MLEKKMEEDAELKEKLVDRPLRFISQKFDDKKLLSKLRSFGIEMDRSSLERLCNESLSAEEIATPLIEKALTKIKDSNERIECDWIWICIDALWRRWFPEIPSFEILDDKIMEGYEINDYFLNAGCRIWLEAWDDALILFDKAGIKTISEFDDRFKGTEYFFDWIQDLEMQLWNAGIRDRRFHVRRIEVCEERLRFEDDPSHENCRAALGQSLFELGETDKVDDLFQEWLKIDPQWEWGWISWSDCYSSTRTQFADQGKAEEILLKGLAIPGVRSPEEIADRLVSLYEDQDRHDEANEMRRQVELLSKALKPSSTVALTEAPLNEHKGKIQRNDPCPCGSGKKYKKCCSVS